MNQLHDFNDDVGEWAQDHPVTRRSYIAKGCDQQGRQADGTWVDLEDQSISGTGMWLGWLARIFLEISFALGAVLLIINLLAVAMEWLESLT